MVESQPSKLLVAGPIPVSRSIFISRQGQIVAAMYEKAVLSVEDPHVFHSVHRAVEAAFSPSGVEAFLKSIDRTRLRIRSFETVLNAKLLGETAKAEYSRLGNADQGQIREFYLDSLEQVAPSLRQKFFKLYAYY